MEGVGKGDQRDCERKRRGSGRGWVTMPAAISVGDATVPYLSSRNLCVGGWVWKVGFL